MGLGFEFKGAPTFISQRWPGCPCGGFMPGAVVVDAVVAVTCGVVTGIVVPDGIIVLVADPFRVIGIAFCCGLIGPVSPVSDPEAGSFADAGTTVLSTAETSLDEPVLHDVNMIPIRPTADKILFIKIPRFKYPG